MTLDIKTLTTAELHDEMLRLRQERHMDFLVNLIGMDYYEAKDTYSYLDLQIDNT